MNAGGRTGFDCMVMAIEDSYPYLYLSLYIYIYIHLSIYLVVQDLDGRRHTYIHTYIHTYLPTYMHACMHAYIYINPYIRMVGETSSGKKKQQAQRQAWKDLVPPSNLLTCAGIRPSKACAINLLPTLFPPFSLLLPMLPAHGIANAKSMANLTQNMHFLCN